MDARCLRALRRWALAASLLLLPFGAWAQAGCVSGISQADVFGYAEANFPALFPQAPTSGTYQQYNYRYYAGTTTYLALDAQCNIYLLGPLTGGAILNLGTVAGFATGILQWKVLVLGGTPCTYHVYPTSLSFGGEGGHGTVQVAQDQIACTVPNPPWVIVSGANWITNEMPGALSNGQGPAYFYVQPNTAVTARTGVVTVAGTQVTVNQSAGATPLAGSYNGRWSGSCTLFGNVSGTFSVTISAQGIVTGSFMGDDSGSFSGSVDASGSLSTASGVAAGGAYWTGTIVAGGAGSSGSWSEPGCSGGWSIP